MRVPKSGSTGSPARGCPEGPGAPGGSPAKLASGAEGRVLTPRELREDARLLRDATPAVRQGNPVWVPAWDRAWVLLAALALFAGEWYLANLFGNLHAQQDWELFGAIPIGGRVRSRSTIIDRFSKRGRDYVVNETDLCDADSGRLLVRQWGETEEFTFNQVMTYPIRSSSAPEGVIDLLGPPW